jgi:hypothetical protein
MEGRRSVSQGESNPQDIDGQFSSLENGTWVRLLARDISRAHHYTYLSDGPTYNGKWSVQDVPQGVVYDLETSKDSASRGWVSRDPAGLVANAAYVAVAGSNAIKVGAVRPVVSGSRGANAALASLLTALAQLGIIVDNSS